MPLDVFFFSVAIGVIVAALFVRIGQAERHQREIVDLIDALATMIGEMLDQRGE